MAAATASTRRPWIGRTRTSVAATSVGGPRTHLSTPLFPPSSHQDDTFDFLGEAGGEGRGEASGVWQRLHHSGASTSAISLGWRILYAALPVRSKVAYYLHLPVDEGLCEAPGCCCQETISHAFMECEKVKGAIDWLLNLYQAICGRRPPCDPRVILTDDNRVWDAGGSKEEQLLWQRLRLSVLHHTWLARSSRQRFQDRRTGDLSRAIISGASADIQRAIQRDWARTRLVATLEEAGGNGCSFSGRDPTLTAAAFTAMWTGNNVLCRFSTTAVGGMILREPEAWLAPRVGGVGGGHIGGGGAGNPQGGGGGRS